MPPSLCIVSLPTTTNLPEPAICHPSRLAEISDADPAFTSGNAALAITWAVRRAIVNAVSDGFAEPSAGNTAGPAAKQFVM